MQSEIHGRVCDVARSLPQVYSTRSGISHEISRDSYLELIDTTLTEDIEVLLVEGEEGVGRTTFLSQIVKHKYLMNSISLFLRPTRWLCEPEAIKTDICNQINYILSGKELPDDFTMSDSQLDSFYFKLVRKAKKTKTIYYFIVDGLESLPSGPVSKKYTILDILPFGHPSVKFIISGSKDENEFLKNKKIQFKNLPIGPFTVEESKQYLLGLRLDQNQLHEIITTCQRVPARLSSVFRIIDSADSSFDISYFIQSLPQTLPELFEVEWSSTHAGDFEMVLSLIAFQYKHLTVDEICNVLDIENVTNLKESIGEIPFLTTSGDGSIRYISESFRKFACEKLNAHKNEITDKIVSFFLSTPDKPDSYIFLPKQLIELGRNDQLLEYLTPDLFTAMLKSSESMCYLRENSKLGLDSALATNNDSNVFKFALQNSAINSIETSEIWRSEVNAYLSLGLIEEATTLAQSNVLKEERMLLLAVVAKHCQVEGFQVPPEIEAQLLRLSTEINFKFVKEKAYSISAELIYTLPDLAVSIIETALDADPDENALDLAYLRLSMQTLAVNKNDDTYKTVANSISSRIKDTDLQLITRSVSSVVSNSSPEVIIAEVAGMKETSNKLQFLRRWLIQNKQHERAHEVIRYTIKLIVSSTAYAPSVTVLRDIATPLPYIEDIDVLKELVETLDKQHKNLEYLGPSVENVRLQLILAESELKLEYDKASERMVSLYLYIEGIQDSDVKAECLIWLKSLREKFEEIESKEGLFELSNESLDEAITTIIENTADHYLLLKSIVQALVEYDLSFSKEVVSKFNTETRRNLGYLTLIEALDDKLSNLPPEEVLSIIDSITDKHMQSNAILKLAECVYQYCNDISLLIKYKDYFTKADLLLEPGDKCKIIAHIIKRHNLSEQLKANLYNAWNSIDVGWNRINVGYQIVTLLSRSNPELAREYMKMTHEFKESVVLHSPSVAFTYTGSLLLLIRSITGLLPHITDVNNEIDMLRRLIVRVPSGVKQVTLWGELAYRVYSHHSPEAEKIISEEMIPLLEEVRKQDLICFENLAVEITPVLYTVKPTLGLRYVDLLPYPQKDTALANICYTILTKTLPHEPYNFNPKSSFNPTYDEILDIVDLLNKMDADCEIYHQVCHIVNSVSSKKNRFSEQQKTEITQKLNDLIKNKFPNQRYIQHRGYVIAGLATLSKLEKSPNWENLISDAERDIKNVSDKCYVLLVIAESFPVKKQQKALELIKTVVTEISRIPSIFDRLGRYEYAAEVAASVDLRLSKEIIRKAMELTQTLSGNNHIPAQRNLIDLAYRLDPNLASSLSSIADADPARAEERFRIKEKMAMLEIKSKISNNDEHELNKTPMFMVANICWQLLGEINAQQASPLHFSKTYQFLSLVRDATMVEAYPILSWIIENLNRRSKSPQSFPRLSSIYESLVVCIELIWSLAVDATKRESARVPVNISNPLSIGPNQREKALKRLEEWFQLHATEYIKICDPYFRLEDLEMLKMILHVNPRCKIYVLTGLKIHQDQKIPEPWEDYYRNYWKTKIMTELPYHTEIVLVGLEPRLVFPIHDRWIVSDKSGLRIGTSLADVGISTVSEISVLTQNEAREKEGEIDEYIFKNKRYSGTRVNYRSVSL